MISSGAPGVALGHNIHIISGQEEARLVFVGVAHSVYNHDGASLVIDIGGGSTEIIIGKGFQPRVAESLYMGCVNVSRRFFPDGKITGRRMRDAVLFARTELETIEAGYRRIGWDTALGSSGDDPGHRRYCRGTGLERRRRYP